MTVINMRYVLVKMWVIVNMVLQLVKMVLAIGTHMKRG